MVEIDPCDINPIANAIFKAYEDREERNTELRRGHIGASSIGKECERELWYEFRWVADEKFEGRMLRLFQRGHDEEDKVIADLRAIDCQVYVTDKQGKRFRKHLHGGHYSGEFDAVVKGLPGAPDKPHIVEIKTHKNTSYNAVVKHGVDKKKPLHAAQMQALMDFFDIDDALYFPVCKNSDNLFPTRHKRKKKEGKALRQKALRIIEAEKPPARASDSPKAFVCKFCKFRDNCFEQKVADVSCRTCVHATPGLDGEAEWLCDESSEGQCVIGQVTCPDHLFIPELVPLGEPVEAGEGWIKYKTGRGREFFNVAASGFPADDAPHYSSKELRAMDAALVDDPGVSGAVGLAKEILGGEVIK